MPRITFIEHTGAEHEIDAKPGLSLMEVAVNNSIPGIDADCGGACACATCHVYVDAAWTGQVGERGSLEESMLGFADTVAPSSRLACQIRLTDQLDGLVVRLPKSQH